MKFMIKHEAKGRMRIHAVQNRMSYAQADTLLYFLHSQKEVTLQSLRQNLRRSDLLCR